MREKKIRTLSLICFIVCLLIWVPNLFFQIASPLWLLTFLLAPVGIALGVVVKNYWLIAVNTLMLFSFFIFMALGYFVNSKT
ncbi:hypothetical protein [Pontibacillus yanchengensis]|uniref:Uncharacterized protein n=1 Tax=Pontibacillus yanchengensis Y32 TaxID=1385514 RepID=A0A0A2TAD5_9BACI|nr:hypothetical protein [Pontibacillus yanchengensis]KGP71051.1 hypothetical protein N782_01735 [Pontibacillus yanchengensis Y32]